MKVEVVNMGRRPVRLALFRGRYEGGGWSGRCLGDPDKGVLLTEGERFTENIEATDHMLLDRETGDAATDLWFEDTVGRRYAVRDARENLARLFGNGRRPKEGLDDVANAWSTLVSPPGLIASHPGLTANSRLDG